MGRKAKDHPDQEGLPGIAPEKNPKVHRWAKKYDAQRDVVGNEREKLKDLKKSLIETMRKEGLKEYRWGDVVIKDNSKDDVTVKVGESDGSADEEEPEEANGLTGE